MDKESEVQYLFIINDNSIYPEHKNTMSKNFADTIVRNNMQLKVKLNLIDKIQKDFNKQSLAISEFAKSYSFSIKKARHWHNLKYIFSCGCMVL